MKHFGKSGILLTVVFTLLVIFTLIGCSKTSEKFQKDADIIRLRHLIYYGRLIEQYHRITGKYPLQHIMPMRLYVYVANDEQIEYTEQQNAGTHAEVPFGVFVKQVESALGREINEYYDPQYAPDDKPNFYVYTIHDDTYHFEVNVHQPYPFAIKIAENFYKVVISSAPDPDNNIFAADQLFNSAEFNKELDKKVSKESFFEEREDKYLHHTKSRQVKDVPVPEKDIM